MKPAFKKAKLKDMTPIVKFTGNPITRGSPQSAGYDIKSNEIAVTLNPGEFYAFSTNVYMTECDERLYFRVAPRSGLAVKHGIDVLAGVIDSDYRGEIKVVLVNLNDTPIIIDKGMRIAQLIPTYYAHDAFISNTETIERERGTNGFGSSGK